jgi:hypothetical protein
MALWKHGFRGKTLVFAVTAAACQAFLLLGFDQGSCFPRPNAISDVYANYHQV